MSDIPENEEILALADEINETDALRTPRDDGVAFSVLQKGPLE